MMLVNTAEHFQTTRIVKDPDVTASVTAIGIEQSLNLILEKMPGCIGMMPYTPALVCMADLRPLTWRISLSRNCLK